MTAVSSLLMLALRCCCRSSALLVAGTMVTHVALVAMLPILLLRHSLLLAQLLLCFSLLQYWAGIDGVLNGTASNARLSKMRSPHRCTLLLLHLAEACFPLERLHLPLMMSCRLQFSDLTLHLLPLHLAP